MSPRISRLTQSGLRRYFTCHNCEKQVSDFRHQNAILHFVLRAHCATAFAVFLSTQLPQRLRASWRKSTLAWTKDPPQARSVSCLPDAPFTPMTPRACACHGRPDVPPSSENYARRASGKLTPTLAGCAPHQFYSLCSFPLVFFARQLVGLFHSAVIPKKDNDTGRCDLISSFSRDRRARPRDQVAFRPRDGRPFEQGSFLPKPLWLKAFSFTSPSVQALVSSCGCGCDEGPSSEWFGRPD